MNENDQEQQPDRKTSKVTGRIKWVTIEAELDGSAAVTEAFHATVRQAMDHVFGEVKPATKSDDAASGR